MGVAEHKGTSVLAFLIKGIMVFWCIQGAPLSPEIPI